MAETNRTLTHPLPSLIYWGVGGIRLPNYANYYANIRRFGSVFEEEHLIPR